jgi:hypothetical protein
MKQQLAELIEAYAAARASGSRLLLEYAVTQLNDFMSKVEVTEVKEKTE